VAQLPLRLQEGSRLGFAQAAVPRMGLEPGLRTQLELLPERSMDRLRSKTWLLGRPEGES